MDQRVRDALGRSAVVDITTTGRLSGEPRRIEIFMHSLGGRLVISGMPRPEKRAWLANLEADPRLTLHLKQGIEADLQVSARIVTSPGERRQLLEQVARAWKRTDVDLMVEQSPLIELMIEGFAAADAA
jgi:deazaflavin-dependent oxidoreductase (nitroreductase family)